MIIMAPISVGELLDKITILSIKLVRITDPDKRQNVLNEFNQLNKIAESEIKPVAGLDVLYRQLYQINNSLWDIENNKRRFEKLKCFDNEFIELSRQVYLQNDIRAKIKRQINELLGSSIIEEKQHN